MDHNVDEHSDIQATAQAAAEMRAEAVEQLKSARDLAKRVRAEAMHELEDARERVARIAAREEEMAEQIGGPRFSKPRMPSRSPKAR